MGLLDVTDDPQTLGLLSLGLRLMSTPGRFGTALGQSGLGALGDMRQARAAQGQREQQEMQRKLMQSQIKENEAAALKRKADAEELVRKAGIEATQRRLLQDAVSPVKPHEANAASGVVGPRPEALSVIGQPRPIDGAALQSLIAAGIDPKTIQALAESRNWGRPKISKAVEAESPTGGLETRFFDEFANQVGKPVPKGSKETDEEKKYARAVADGYKGTFQDYQVMLRRAGAANFGTSLVPVEIEGKPALVQTMPGRGGAQVVPGMTPLDPNKKGSQVDKVAARERLQEQLEYMAGLYGELKRLGGISSTEEGAAKNLWSSARSSLPGQLAGRAVGTEESKIRDIIAGMKPGLITTLMESGLKTGSINSNAELMFWLQATTDPSRGYESQLELLNQFATKYGTGRLTTGTDKKNKTTGGRKNIPPAPEGVPEDVWLYMTDDERALWQKK